MDLALPVEAIGGSGVLADPKSWWKTPFSSLIFAERGRKSGAGAVWDQCMDGKRRRRGRRRAQKKRDRAVGEWGSGGGGGRGRG
jgi:hypothetical protein